MKNEQRNPARLAPLLIMVGGLYGQVQAAALRDACSLLSQAQVAAALGAEVDPGVRPVESDPLSCNWREHGKPTGPARNVILYIYDAQKFDSGKTRVAHMPSAMQSGIGDDAYWFRPGRLPITLTVKKGDAYFRLMTRSDAAHPADDQDKAIDKALALDVLKHL
jgi:hypothetical protein